MNRDYNTGIPTYRMLGVTVNPSTISQLNHVVESYITSLQGCIVANHNLHSAYLFHHDPSMREFYGKAQFIHIDGMPLVFMARLLGYPIDRSQRVTYMDWIMPLMELAAEKRWRVYYLGSAPGVAERGAEIMLRIFPALQIRATHGYFDPAPGSKDNTGVISAINGYRPDLLMVGMGMPRQEHWILDNLAGLEAKVILTCGACMDYVAGVIPTPPRWMGKVGLEWFYRLISEPGRLWKRYLLEPWFVFGLFMRDLWQVRIKKKEFGGGDEKRDGTNKPHLTD